MNFSFFIAVWVTVLTTICRGNCACCHEVVNKSHTGTREHKTVAGIIVSKRYLWIPIQVDAKPVPVSIHLDGEKKREFNWPKPTEKIDFYSFLEIGEWKGQTLTVHVNDDLVDDSLIRFWVQSDKLPNEELIYREPYRPQLHFTAKRGWLNDPNGLYYYDGNYHLFYQATPFALSGGPRHWGHAVSEDLIRWKELPVTLYPDSMGQMWSGGAVVDSGNTSGMKKGNADPIFLFYTAAGGTPWSSGKKFTQCLAYSTDGGHSYEKYKGNPIINNITRGNRDPKVIWHAPTNKWIMILWMEGPGKFSLFTSSNLMNWKHASDLQIPASNECPEILKLAVDGDHDNTRWIVMGANGNYLIGDFDGKKFHKEDGPFDFSYGKNDYAGQFWSNAPNGRALQIAWMSTKPDFTPHPGMPFNQQMTITREFFLKTTPEGLRLHVMPVPEIETLYKEKISYADVELKHAGKKEISVAGQLFDVFIEIDVTRSKYMNIDVNGQMLNFDFEKKMFNAFGQQVALQQVDNNLNLRILVDRTSIELFVNNGLQTLSYVFTPDLYADGFMIEDGEVLLKAVDIYKLESIW